MQEGVKNMMRKPMILESLNEVGVSSSHNDQVLLKLLRRKVVGQTINFKKGLFRINHKDRVSHNIHKFPAKLIHHIPYFFIRNNAMSSVGDTVLDLFCGSGTVLVEAMLAGRNCIGADINPLCRLIAKVKTTRLDKDELQFGIQKLFTTLREEVKMRAPNFPNIDYWFTKCSQLSLTKIKWAIDMGDFSGDIRNFFYVCLSSIIRKSSKADPRISPPVFSKCMRKKVNEGRRVYPIKYFKQEVMKNSKRISKFSSLCFENCESQILSNDARRLSLKNESVDFVITSPPYMSAQKYFRSTRLELFWLGLVDEEELLKLDSRLIGTERIRSSEYSQVRRTCISEADELIEKIYKIDRLRASIVARYFTDLRLVFKEIFRCLKNGKYFVLVIGNNEVRGFKIPSHIIVSKLGEETGFRQELALVDEIKSRGLMTKRNKTAGFINSEWILAFKKEM